MSIIFYSVPSHDNIQHSPNTWRTRMCLKLKGLAFETKYIEYPDIESFQIEHGFAPTGKKFDGSPHYTLPAIYDPSTGAKVTDSWNIALYLDKTYPDTPKVLPPGTIGLQRAWSDTAFGFLFGFFPFIAASCRSLLTEGSVAQFTMLVEMGTRKKFDDVLPTGDDAVRGWAQVKDSMDKLDAWYAAGDSAGEGPFLSGKTPVFGDIVLVAFLLVLRRAFGVDGEKWKEVSSWNNGRWAGLVVSAEELDIV